MTETAIESFFWFLARPRLFPIQPEKSLIPIYRPGQRFSNTVTYLNQKAAKIDFFKKLCYNIYRYKGKGNPSPQLYIF